VRYESAAARVRRRIADWAEREGHGSKKRLAQAVKGLYGKERSGSWVTDVIDGPDKKGQDLRLQDLDAVADAMGIPPGELVSHAEHAYVEVTPSELRLLKFFRALPDAVRQHFMGYLDYLAGLQSRFLHAQADERDQRTAEAKRHRAAMDRKVKNERSGRGPLLRTHQLGPRSDTARFVNEKTRRGDGGGGESAY
jgi:hypothetical protein